MKNNNNNKKRKRKEKREKKEKEKEEKEEKERGIEEKERGFKVWKVNERWVGQCGGCCCGGGVGEGEGFWREVQDAFWARRNFRAFDSQRCLLGEIY